MNIVCSTDDNFVQHCVIMLVSLLTNNEDVTVFVITDNLSESNKKIISDEVINLGGKVYFCPISEEISIKFPMSSLERLNHISRATYFRLLIPEILPDNIRKVIYLDCDIVINSSILSFWNIEMNNYAIAAVLQLGAGTEAERLGYPIEYGYFNAGVTLMNLDYCRANNICNKFMDYIRENSEKLLYNDQDVLNAVLYDKCMHVMPQWNMTSICYFPGFQNRGDSRNNIVINDYKKEKENILKYRKNPPILHYVSRPKPWQKNCVHPLYNLYYFYAKKTINFNHLKPQNRFSRFIAICIYSVYVNISRIKQMIFKTDPSLL